jgi:hypothetical protein
MSAHKLTSIARIETLHGVDADACLLPSLTLASHVWRING